VQTTKTIEIPKKTYMEDVITAIVLKRCH